MITLIAYDVSCNVGGGLDVHAAVKTTLKEKGWQEEIPSQGERFQLPETTLWKDGMNPRQAIDDFQNALQVFNEHERKKHPSELKARGRAIAFSGDEHREISL